MTFTELQNQISTLGIRVELSGLPPLPTPIRHHTGSMLSQREDAELLSDQNPVPDQAALFSFLRQHHPEFHDQAIAYRLQYFDRAKEALARNTRKTLADRLQQRTHYRRHMVGTYAYEIDHKLLTEVLTALVESERPEPEALTKLLVKFKQTQDDVQKARDIGPGHKCGIFCTVDQIDALLQAHGR